MPECNLLSLPVAFFIFFTRATRAWIIAARCFRAYRLLSWLCSRVTISIAAGIMAGKKIDLIQFTFSLFLKLMLVKAFCVEMENMMDTHAANIFHHLLEHSKCFAFIFNQWIFLAVGAQADALFEMIQVKHMLFPCLVYSFKHEPFFCIVDNFLVMARAIALILVDNKRKNFCFKIVALRAG